MASERSSIRVITRTGIGMIRPSRLPPCPRRCASGSWRITRARRSISDKEWRVTSGPLPYSSLVTRSRPPPRVAGRDAPGFQLAPKASKLIADEGVGGAIEYFPGITGEVVELFAAPEVVIVLPGALADAAQGIRPALLREVLEDDRMGRVG